jgi:hypothetical protein
LIFERRFDVVRWLYEHVFRGAGILFLLGLITLVYLAASYLAHRSGDHTVRPAVKTAVP